MKRFALALSALLATAAALAATTVTIPLQVTVTPTQVTIAVPGQTSTIPVPAATPVPPVTPPTAGVFWVYQNGQFNWAGDYSFVLKPTYQDTSGAPTTGLYDLKATLTGQWGGWLPYAGCPASKPSCGIPLWNMDVSGYKTLSFDAKAVAPGQVWSVYFVKVGDVALPKSCGQVVPAGTTGVWETHVLSLASLCVGPGLAGGTQIYKFAIQDQTGLAANTWFLNNVGFAP